MRWTMLAGVVTALAFLIPAAPAAAQAASPGLNEACQPVERREYKDLRTLIDIDPETAPYVEVRVRANQILAAARAESLPRTPDETQKALDGTEEGLRTFLKTGMKIVWSQDLLVLVTQSLATGGPHVKAAAGKVLDEGTVEAALAYLNDGLYVARELDCQAASQTPTPTPTGGALPKTGANTSALALGGVVMVAIGVGALLLARRSRAS